MLTGALYGRSSRMLYVDGHALPYAVNQTITYRPDDDDDGGRRRRMPYLVQQLRVDDIGVERSVDDNALHYDMTTTVSKGATFALEIH